MALAHFEVTGMLWSFVAIELGGALLRGVALWLRRRAYEPPDPLSPMSPCRW